MRELRITPHEVAKRTNHYELRIERGGGDALIASPVPRFPSLLCLLLALLFATLAPAPVCAQDVDYDKELAEQRRELDAVRARLKREQRELENLKRKSTATLGELRRLESSIAETNRYLRQLEETERTLMASLDETRGDLRRIESRLRTRSEVLAARARQLYMSGRPGNLLFIPGSGESDFLERVHLVRALLRHDRRLLEAHRRDRALQRDHLEKLNSRHAELEEFQQRKQREMRSFARARDNQEQTLKSLRRDEATRARALKELEENAEELDAIIRELERRRQEQIARGLRREIETGVDYCPPVRGTVVSRYGLQHHATLGTSTRNLGIEIEGGVRAPVRAAVSGEVAMVTNIPGYGRGIILDNGSGYFTIYGNLAGIRVSPGDQVRTCQDMAIVADIPGRVYFEVRQGTNTLDPQVWLRGPGR